MDMVFNAETSELIIKRAKINSCILKATGGLEEKRRIIMIIPVNTAIEYVRQPPFNIPGVLVDGGGVIAVYETKYHTLWMYKYPEVED